MPDESEEAPPVVDSSYVRAYAVVRPDVVFTSKQRVFVGGVKVGPASRLVVAFNGRSNDYLLLLCDEDWESFAAAGAPTIEDAIDQAERWYAGISNHWVRTAYTSQEDRLNLEEYYGDCKCSFCGALPSESREMVRGENAWICNGCIASFHEDLDDEPQT